MLVEASLGSDESRALFEKGSLPPVEETAVGVASIDCDINSSFKFLLTGSWYEVSLCPFLRMEVSDFRRSKLEVDEMEPALKKP